MLIISTGRMRAVGKERGKWEMKAAAIDTGKIGFKQANWFGKSKQKKGKYINCGKVGNSFSVKAAVCSNKVVQVLPLICVKPQVK